jgi:leukotriene-A4 hydrolase
MPDPATQSNYLAVYSEHLHFDWTIDFDSQTLCGSVEHVLSVLQDVTCISLDTSYLDIKSCDVNGESAAFTIHPRHPVMGSRLDIDASLRKGDTAKLKIAYSTTSQCTALGWLKKDQTEDGTHPFVFSQCQGKSRFVGHS